MLIKKKDIEIRAFVLTGHDDIIWYVDMLERAVLKTHAKMTGRKTVLPRKRIDEALKELYKRTKEK